MFVAEGWATKHTSRGLRYDHELLQHPVCLLLLLFFLTLDIHILKRPHFEQLSHSPLLIEYSAFAPLRHQGWCQGLREGLFDVWIPELVASCGKLRKIMALSDPETPTMMGIDFGIVRKDLGSTSRENLILRRE